MPRSETSAARLGLMRVLVVIGTVRSCNALDLPARCPELAQLYGDAQVGDIGRAIRFDACLGLHVLGCHVDTSCNMLYIVCLRNIESL